jgi:oxygen-dependent protoporphyrinogen oxidase
MAKRRYAIVGAGITGLTSAHLFLSLDKDCEVTIFERNVPGGNLRSVRIGDIQVDAGPDSFLTRKTHALDISKELGLGSRLTVPTLGTIDIYDGFKLKQFPPKTYMGIPTDLAELKKSNLVSSRALKIVSKGRKVETYKGGDTTVYELLVPRFGEEVIDLMIEPIMAGIHAGTAKSLGVAATAPEVLAAALSPGPLMDSLKKFTLKNETLATYQDTDKVAPFYGIVGGMNLLTDKLVDSIVASGKVKILIGHEVCAINLENKNEIGDNAENNKVSIETTDRSYIFDAVVVATDGAMAAELFRSIDQDISAELSLINHASVAMVFFAIKQEQIISLADKRGILLPRSSKLYSTAITFLSNKWKHMRNENNSILRVAVGSIENQAHLNLSPDELTNKILNELNDILKLKIDPIDSRVVYYNNAFPQYGPNHLTWAKKVRKMISETGNVRLASSILGGIGLSDRILAGATAAGELLKAEDRPF